MNSTRSILTSFPDFQESSVAFNLFSPTVPLTEVIFPSLTICNMNTLRRSLVLTLIDDPALKDLGVTYSELKKIVHLMYIDGGDYELNDRERAIVESRASTIKVAWVRF